MSDPSDDKAGPTLNSSVQEVRGVFPSEAAMETAISQLTLAGFDRAAFSMPKPNLTPGQSTPEMGADAPMTDTDIRQTRTMGTSMAGTIGAFAAAGAVVATGGAAAIAAVAAAAVGAGAALTANTAGNVVDGIQAGERADAAAAGQLVLTVATPDWSHQVTAERIMQETGATNVEIIDRGDKGLDSAGWTG